MKSTSAEHTAAARQELGVFLRDRRGRLQPAAAGLVSAGRRRTPGLRREEVAALAGVGVTWYTWLEQGRKINASRQVIDAVCRALNLGLDESKHVLTLAGFAPSTMPDECEAVTKHHLAALESFLPYPACIQNGRYDLLAWNRSYRFLIADLHADLPNRSNNLVAAFLGTDWEQAYGAAYEDVCSSMVARFRAAMAGHLKEEPWLRIRNSLTARSPLFAAMWRQNQVLLADQVVKEFTNPQVGELRLQFNTFWLEPNSDRRLVVVTPDDAASKERLARLDALHADQEPMTRRPVGLKTLGEQVAAA